MAFYPSIKDDQVMTMTLVRQNLMKDPTYLDKSDCPYSKVVKEFFRVTQPMVASPDIFEEGDDVETIERQIKTVLSDLDGMASQMASAESGERLNYFKTKAALLEKLISMQERVFNLRELQVFRNAVMNGLDLICDKDQITKFMRDLDGILGLEQNL